jgi:hypothetical protein
VAIADFTVLSDWRFDYLRRREGKEAVVYPAEPLVSYQINRQLSGWNLPPLVIRAFGAHCQQRTFGSICISDPADRALPYEEAQFHIAEGRSKARIQRQ